MRTLPEISIFYVATQCNQITGINLRQINRWVQKHNSIPVTVTVYYAKPDSVIRLSQRYVAYRWRKLPSLKPITVLRHVIFPPKSKIALFFSDACLLNTTDIIPMINALRNRNTPLVIPHQKQSGNPLRMNSAIVTWFHYFLLRVHLLAAEHFKYSIQFANFPCGIHAVNMRYEILKMNRQKRFLWFKKLSRNFNTGNLRLFLASTDINVYTFHARGRRLSGQGNGLYDTAIHLYKSLVHILEEKEDRLKINITQWTFPVAQLSIYLYFLLLLAGIKNSYLLIICAMVFSFPFLIKPNGPPGKLILYPVDLIFRFLLLPFL